VYDKELHLTASGRHLPYELPPNTSTAPQEDSPVLDLSALEGQKAAMTYSGLLHTEMVCLSTDSHPSK